jgi:hypothetical protein
MPRADPPVVIQVLEASSHAGPSPAPDARDIGAMKGSPRGGPSYRLAFVSPRPRHQLSARKQAEQRISELRGLLSGTSDLLLSPFQKLEQDDDLPPGSPVAEEQHELASRPEIGFDIAAVTVSYGNIAVLAAADHLESMAASLRQSTKAVFGVLALARVAVEANAKACWILDAELTAFQRFTRVMQLREMAVYKAIEMLVDFDATPDVIQSQRDRHAEVLAQAKAAGLDVVERDGELKGLKGGRPTPTDLVHEHLDTVGVESGTAIYAALSGIVHTDPNMVIQFRDLVTPARPGVLGRVQVRLTVSDAETAVCLAAVSSMRTATLAHWYSNQPPARVVQWDRHVRKTLFGA